jgi:hypothetical protein
MQNFRTADNGFSALSDVMYQQLSPRNYDERTFLSAGDARLTCNR